MSTKNKQFFKTAIFGSGGYIGSYLLNRFSALDESTIGLSKKKLPYFDLCKPLSWQFDPCIDYGIICAGLAKINECEKDPENTYFVNVEKTLKFAEHLINLKITPIIFSTDYVFDGKDRNYSELSSTNAVNEYGKQKQLLEKKLMSEFTDRSVILRLSKVYGNEKEQNTFINEMIDLFTQNKIVKAAIDQIFCPVHLEDIFKAISFIQTNKLAGLFNVCGSVAWQRYDIAELIAEMFGFSKNLIKKISLKDLGENFKRPFNTSMISNRLNLQTFSSIEDNILKILKNYERKESLE